VTALCLHADAAHVVGNAVATLIFVSAAGDWVGPGLALFCTIMAGVVGNLAAALVDPAHHAIGFSTATFGALGLSSVFGFVARYRDRASRQRAWLALGGGLALLGMLGAGERSDVLAHLFGLGAGVGLGVLVSSTGRVGARERVVAPGWLQLVAALGSVALIATAWLWALPQIHATP
jgi:membrane associated rhomboid family serine protease